MADNRFGALLATIVETAAAGLTTPVGRVEVAPGAMLAWDDCCSGMCWSRLIAVTAGGNSSIVARPPCSALYWIATIGVGVLRCAHTVNDDGTPPTAYELTADALGMTQDMHDLAKALNCAQTLDGLSFTSWAPMGPDGGCVGGEWTLSLRLPVECC